MNGNNNKNQINSKQLPSKENALFRSIVKFYETKQYKKGLKAADAILKKFPDHGETLSMKGLTLNCMGKKEEAYEYVRNGLKHDLKSHVSWHVYGLLYRSDHDNAEAIKCYRNALRIDPYNLQILRDLYLLQIQIRDLKGYCEARRFLLRLKPNNRMNWIGFAISHHLNDNRQMAIDIIDKYTSTLESSLKANYEDSEMMLYKNQLLCEEGMIQEAYDHLLQVDNMILDRIFIKQKRAEYLVRLQKFNESRTLYEELLKLNPENYDYHRGIQCCFLEATEHLNLKGNDLPSSHDNGCMKKENMIKLIQFYEEEAKNANSKCLIWLRILMDCTEGECFKTHLDTYLRRQLVNGVPSLGSSCKFFYTNSSKIKVFQDLLNSYLEILQKGDHLINGHNSPTVNLWTYYLAAQHYDRMQDFMKALEYIDKCIEHTPTLIDFYQRKARILKHCGDLNAASTIMTAARKLDLADRYINNKATEYLLHADLIEEADATIALFTRHEGDPQQNLYDMQCMWYEIECGKSYQRQNDFGMALKRFFAVEKHFNDFVDDQFDFHTYCVRKMTLRAYVQMLKFADEVYGHKYFVQAAFGIIQCYLSLYDNPHSMNGLCSDMDFSKMSLTEKKKAKRAIAKARKAEFKKKEDDDKATKEEHEVVEKENVPKEKKKDRREAQVDLDPRGEKLLERKPLEECWKLIQMLKKNNSKDIWTHLYSFDVSLRKKKYLAALEALNQANAICETHPELIRRIVQYNTTLKDENQNNLHAIVLPIIKEELKRLLKGQDIMTYLINFQSTMMQSMSNRIVLAEIFFSLNPSKMDEILSLLINFNGNDVKLENCEKILNFLKHELKRDKEAQEFSLKCHEMFPYASAFGNGYKMSL